MKRLLSILFCLCATVYAFAQTNVTGKVTDYETGDELIGVTVKVKGTNVATVTDIDGQFSLAARNGQTLVFTYVGYKDVEQKVDGGKCNIQMHEDKNDLNEVVVVGHGTAKRITMTGAVSAINGKELQKVPVSSVQNALAGKLPGFFSQQRSGQPGKDASDFFIRGVSSLNEDGNKHPLSDLFISRGRYLLICLCMPVSCIFYSICSGCIGSEVCFSTFSRPNI